MSADDKAAAAWDDYVSQQQEEKIEQLERELNAANERIKRLEAVVNDPHALWANWLRGDVKLPAGIGDVRQYQDRIRRLEEAIQERDKEWFQVIESILGFHPVSMTEALRIGIERIKKQKQRIKRLEEAGDELIWAFCPASVSMMTERESDALKLWNEAKEAKP